MKQILSKLVYNILQEQRNTKRTKNKQKSRVDREPSTTELEPVEVRAFRLNPPITNSVIVHEFGERRGLGRIHKGVDFRCNVGTPVYAIKDGEVVAATTQYNKFGNEAGWGNYIIIQHDKPDGQPFFSLYAHLSKMLVQTGQMVTSGQNIGLSGGDRGAPGSGNSQDPHLHFEIKTSIKDGEINPRDFYNQYKQDLFLNKLGILPSATSQDSYDTPSYDRKSDQSVTTSTSTSVPSSIESTDSVNTNEIRDGFKIYRIVGDEKWIYGVPTSENTKAVYGWWAYSDEIGNWVNLQATLSDSNYNTATQLLNSKFPNAIDASRLSATKPAVIKKEKPLDIDTVPDKKDNSKFKNLKVNTIYVPSYILNQTNNVPIFQYKQGKFSNIKGSDGKPQAFFAETGRDKLQYLGHDTKEKYAHFKIYINNTPDLNFWIESKYIK